MSEALHDSPEKKYSPEQERLLQTARELLALPDVVEPEPYYRYRQTTREEKFKYFASKILRWQQPANAPSQMPLYETPASKTSTKIITIRALNRPDLHEGGWAGGVRLEEQTVEDLATNTTKQSLIVYATQIVNSRYGVSELSAYDDERPWQVNLLEVIEDPAEIARLQADFDARLAEGSA